MANEVIQQSGAALAAALAMQVIEEARPAMAGLPTCRIKSIVGVPTLAEKFTLLPGVPGGGGTAPVAGSISDGTAMSNQAVTISSVTITAAAVGLGGVVTDLSKEGSLLTPEVVRAHYGRGVMEKIDTDVTSNYASFTQNATVGTSGQPMSIGNFQSAQYELEVAKAPGSYVTVLHTIQLLYLRNALIGAVAGLWANPSQEMVDGIYNNIGKNALKGSLMGTPVYQSPTCATANAGVDRVGAMYVQGDDTAGLGALAFLWKWALRLEELRQPLYPGAQEAATAAYGTGILVSGYGVKIVNSAT